jgi:hypothetical protein
MDYVVEQPITILINTSEQLAGIFKTISTSIA